LLNTLINNLEQGGRAESPEVEQTTNKRSRIMRAQSIGMCVCVRVCVGVYLPDAVKEGKSAPRTPACNKKKTKKIRLNGAEAKKKPA